jgi:hypothetical protein
MIMLTSAIWAVGLVRWTEGALHESGSKFLAWVSHTIPITRKPFLAQITRNSLNDRGLENEERTGTWTRRSRVSKRAYELLTDVVSRRRVVKEPCFDASLLGETVDPMSYGEHR